MEVIWKRNKKMVWVEEASWKVRERVRPFEHSEQKWQAMTSAENYMWSIKYKRR